MSVCYVLSDQFYDRLVKKLDPGDAREIIDNLEAQKRRADAADAILERKTLQGTSRVRQIKVGQWRIAALYVRGIDIAEVIQLCYLYNKNQNGEPDQNVLEEIDTAAKRLFEDAADWPPDDQSAYLEAMQTQLPEP